MSRLPELSYALSEARSTPLLAEFNSILNLGETFGPLLPLDAAISFYTPLRSSLADLRGAPASFERASEALYLRDNLWRIAGDGNPRFNDGGLLMETAITNKCENYNANPDAALTNMTFGGDPATDLTRELDVGALASAGLGQICDSGYAFYLDNSGASADGWAQVQEGRTGNTNVHTVSVWARGSGRIQIRFFQGSTTWIVLTDEYQRISFTGPPQDANQGLRLLIEAGDTCHFVLTQMEESPGLTSPIITAGTAGQRAADVLTYGGLTNFFNQPAGMALFTLRPGVPLQDTAGNRGLLNTRANNIGVAYHDGIAFKTNDGSNSRSVNHGGSAAGDVFYLATRWNDSPSELQIGFRKNGAAWAWSTVVAYDGAFLEEGELFLAPLIVFGYTFADVQLWREDRGTAWIEGNYPP